MGSWSRGPSWTMSSAGHSAAFLLGAHLGVKVLGHGTAALQFRRPSGFPKMYSAGQVEARLRFPRRRE